MDDNLTGILISLGICLALPVLIVWLVSRVRINADNKRSEVIIQAIQANNSIDADKLTEMFASRKKTFPELMLNRLLKGCIFAFIGLAFIIYGFISLGSPQLWEDGGPAYFFVGCILMGIGISYFIVYFIMKRQASAYKTPEAKEC